jgi:hypothetical protein
VTAFGLRKPKCAVISCNEGMEPRACYPFLDEIKNLLLSSGQRFHSVELDTIAPRPVVKRELFTQFPVGLAEQHVDCIISNVFT